MGAARAVHIATCCCMGAHAASQPIMLNTHLLFMRVCKQETSSRHIFSLMQHNIGLLRDYIPGYDL
eukprot:1157719-Pelagomonas_calceolata.AAC.3